MPYTPEEARHRTIQHIVANIATDIDHKMAHFYSGEMIEHKGSIAVPFTEDIFLELKERYPGWIISLRSESLDDKKYTLLFSPKAENVPAIADKLSVPSKPKWRISWIFGK